MKHLAPIGLSTYSRINHLKQTIEALKKNTLASQSELFVFSDAPKPGDEERVVAVRRYLHTVDGFKSVRVIERTENSRINNSRGGMRMLLERYGRMIFLEEDIITAPGFLCFMNDALDFYKDDEDILNITAFCPPINIPSDIEGDIFVLPRTCGWGIGLFNRTIKIISQKIDKQEFESLRDKNVLTIAGEDVLHMIEMDVKGELNAGDVRSMYYQALHNKYTIYPKASLVQNIGIDGSGEHCGQTSKFNHDVLWDKCDHFTFVEDIHPDPRIVAANQKFRRLSSKAKFLNRVRNTPLYPVLKSIKRLFLVS